MQNQIDRQSLSAYLRERWAGSGMDVGEETEAPHREQMKLLSAEAGFCFGLNVHRAGDKARAGVWFLRGPSASVNDVAALRSHYQQTLQRQGKGVRIHNCRTEFGTIFLFFDTTAAITSQPEAFSGFTDLVEELAALAFDSDALDEYLSQFR